MRKKINVAVLMGGKSAEHDISLKSGREVIKNLNSSKYEVLPIVITKDGASNFIDILKKRKLDVVFIALHGPYGEDGTIQGLLELLDIRYTGSGILTSSLGMDKIYSRKLFTQAGLKVPKSIILHKGENQPKIFKALKFPFFVKPSNQGSSVGTTKAKNRKELQKALKTAFSYSNPIIMEEYVEGTEITCAILGNKNPKALPLVEIIPKKDFFDYEAKYDANLTNEICPAQISKTLTKKAQKAALIAYKTLNCHGFGRVDMIIKGQNVYVLEVNTIPGLTPVSLFPKAAKADGISYPQLLDKIINFSLNP